MTPEDKAADYTTVGVKAIECSAMKDESEKVPELSDEVRGALCLLDRKGLFSGVVSSMRGWLRCWD